MVIHGIPNPIFLHEDRDLKSMSEAMVATMRRSVEDLIPAAQEVGVRMLLENLPYNRDLRAAGKDGDYPLMRMADLRAFIEDFPPEQVGLIVDVGHAWTDGMDPAREILIAGDRLWGTHLQDVDRDNPQDNHWAPLDVAWTGRRSSRRFSRSAMPVLTPLRSLRRVAVKAPRNWPG